MSSQTTIPHQLQPALVTVSDAMNYLSLSQATLYRLMGRKKIATVKAGQRTL